MILRARPLLLIIALMLLPGAVLAAANATRAETELRELRNRIGALQKKLDATEETKNEASDALRESERAISEAKRELHALNRQARDTNTKLQMLRKSSRETRTALNAQQDLLGRMLRHQYMRGEPETLRLVLGGQHPSEMARQLHYLGYVARARAQLLEGLRANLREIDRLRDDIAVEAAAIARIAAEQTTQKKQLEREQRARTGVLAKVSQQISAQQREIRGMRANENRLTRLVDQLARLVARKPATTTRPRLRNEAVPTAPGDGAIFSDLRGLLALPVRGELGSRFGGQRADGGVTWKGLFIAAKSGDEVRAVAAGRVVYADWLRGFGNLLIIDHGESYMTLYANAEALLKRVGEVIRGGETVATVGNSGGNTESGLYFEMRHEGRPFDPLDWVKLR